MISSSKEKQIKELIRKGFDLELISFELDIPLEEINQFKLQLETGKKDNKPKTHNVKEIIDQRNKAAHLKIKHVKERYNKAFFTVDKSEVKLPSKPSRQEIERINLKIEEIKNIIAKMEGFSEEEKRKNINLISSKLKTIEKYNLSIEQSEKLYNLMQSEELKNMNKGKAYRKAINSNRNISINKLIESIDIAQYQTENVEELKRLEKRLTPTLAQEKPLIVGAIRTKISNKILKIQQQNAIEKIRNNIPIEIEQIIRDIASDKLNIQTANAIIDEEAKKRIENKSKNKFTLTQEQERKQILIQIKTVLAEKSKQYNIENPEKAIAQIQELCGGDTGQSLRTVIKNLIGSKKYNKAKEICDKFSDNDKESQNLIYIKRLRNEIRNAEISDIVMRVINTNGTIEEERACIELIEKGLKIGNVKPRAVYLGKNQDGSRSITLEDVWTDEKTKRYTR